MNNLYGFLIFILALSPITNNAQNTNESILDIINGPELSSSTIGLTVADFASGETVIDINGNKLLTPASTAKLITNFTALNLLGLDTRFKTTISYRGNIGKDDTLEGDLIITAGGDPTLGSKRNNPNGSTTQWIDDIAKELKNNNISCIKGDIIIDVSDWAGANIPPKWPWEDLGNYYGSGSWPININENMVYITFAGNNQNHHPTEVAKIDPFLPYLSYNNHVRTSTPQGRDQAYIFGGPKQYQREIRGTIPTTTKAFRIKGSLPNPPYDLGIMIKSQLSELFPSADVKISNERIDGAIKLKEYRSLPLKDIVTEANNKSINIYCDAILRLLAQSESGDGSIHTGLDRIEQYFNVLDMPSSDLILKDGSGLSPSNLITTSLMAQFIRNSIEKQPILLNTVPQVGKDGTVRSLLRNSDAATNYRLKSGSMDRVMAYAGVLTAADGKQYAIALIVNNFTEEHRIIKKNIEKILENIILQL